MDNNGFNEVREAHAKAETDRILLWAAQPRIPIQVDLWDIEWLALYFKRSKATVREIVKIESFPRAIRLPLSGKGQALYRAQEVIDWVERFCRE